MYIFQHICNSFYIKCMKLKSCIIIVTDSQSYTLFCSYISVISLLCCGHTFQLSSDTRHKYPFSYHVTEFPMLSSFGQINSHVT